MSSTLPATLPAKRPVSPVPIPGPNPTPKRDPRHAQHRPKPTGGQLTKVRYPLLTLAHPMCPTSHMWHPSHNPQPASHQRITTNCNELQRTSNLLPTEKSPRVIPLKYIAAVQNTLCLYTLAYKCKHAFHVYIMHYAL